VPVFCVGRIIGGRVASATYCSIKRYGGRRREAGIRTLDRLQTYAGFQEPRSPKQHKPTQALLHKIIVLSVCVCCWFVCIRALLFVRGYGSVTVFNNEYHAGPCPYLPAIQFRTKSKQPVIHNRTPNNSPAGRLLTLYKRNF